MKSSRTTIPFPRHTLPPMARLRQHLPTNSIENPARYVAEQLRSSGLQEKIRPHAKVAITAGSRGIGGLCDLLTGICAAVRMCGGEPFIVPAMGSHGGATADGQREVLRRLGVSEEALGIPVRSTMETHTVGVANNGAAAHVDRFAAEADGIIVLGRTKTHPESEGELASGLLKMCAIGLGKQTGAHEAHSHGLWESVRAVPKLQVVKSPILCGVAVVENGYREPCEVEVVPASYDAFLEADMWLLKKAKQHLARIPFDELDLLVVDELGKTVSGAGMDPNVVGHWRNSGGPHEPNYKRIVVLSLTHASLGNGLGIGMADFTTERFVNSYDPAVSYVNLLTASEPGGNTREGPMPLALPSDREAAEVGLFSALPGPAPRVCRIRNTACLDELWISDSLVPQANQNPKLDVLEDAVPLPFDERGNLV